LPMMIERLKADPPRWYALNKLNAAVVAASEPVLEKAEARARRETSDAVAAVERSLAETHRRAVWTQLTNIALGLWLIVGPFAYGLFDGAPGAPVPPAAGHELAAAVVRDAWLGWS